VPLVERLDRLATKADSDSASIAAIKLLLAYGYGTPDNRTEAEMHTQLDREISAALDRLEVAFADEPQTYERALEAIAAGAISPGEAHNDHCEEPPALKPENTKPIGDS
jgi:hypothetical protein